VWLNNIVVFSPDEIRQNDRGGTESTRLKAVSSRSPGQNGRPPPLPPEALHEHPAARFRGTWKRAGSRTPGRGTIKLVLLLEVEVDATMGNRAQI